MVEPEENTIRLSDYSTLQDACPGPQAMEVWIVSVVELYEAIVISIQQHIRCKCPLLMPSRNKAGYKINVDLTAIEVDSETW